MADVFAAFPGQGSQTPGMAKPVLAEFPYTADIFEEASDACSIDLRKLCVDGTEQDLKLTANQQPALLTMAVAYWQVLRHEIDIQPALFAGHSLGEYSALVASGKLQLSEAAKLVRLRGQAMQEAVPAGVGAMAAVLKCEAADLERICSEVASEMGKVCAIANYNSSGQIVISGHSEAISEAASRLKAAGKRAVPLPVSAPFHCSLMAPARQAMTEHIRQATFSDTPQRVIANVTGEIAENYDPELLIRQIDSSVKWQQTMATAQNSGVTTHVEIGPGKVLTGLAKFGLPKAELVNMTDIPAAIESLKN